MKCFIKENSFIAKLAAWKLGVGSVAIVIGRTIHLHNAGKEDLIYNIPWLRHEVAHVKQFSEHGYFLFILKYIFESLKKGYKNNKYEIQARSAECDEKICDGITIVNREGHRSGE